ncbi:MAG: mandelate racemase, partial [Microvirga sp.]
RVDDGLPETLEEVVRHYRGRYYKLKVGGNVAADLERLSGIAAVLDRVLPEYRATLDGNEQYESVEGIAELWRRMRETPALRRLVDAIIFIEQPIKRQVALSRPVATLSDEKPLEIDESDGELSSFPAALALGYTGVSSKNCKGFYKSILNAARVAKLNAEAGRARAFMSAEDLTTWAGVSVQQDLCLVSLLGLTHVERNGHHFIDGMSFAPEAEQAAFVAAHPDLHAKGTGPARLRIAAGRLSIGSLDCPGFAVAAGLDFASMRPMPAAPREPVGRALAAGG